MALSFLEQLLTVAGLAFVSGLMFAVALGRGEIGVYRPVSRAGSLSSAASGAVEEAPRRLRRSKPLTRVVGDSVRDMDPALFWVLVALTALVVISGVITRLG